MPLGSTSDRCTGRIVACERLCILKGMPAGYAGIARRAFSCFCSHQITQITTKAISQRPGDIKNEISTSELLYNDFVPGLHSPWSLLEF